MDAQGETIDSQTPPAQQLPQEPISTVAAVPEVAAIPEKKQAKPLIFLLVIFFVFGFILLSIILIAYGKIDAVPENLQSMVSDTVFKLPILPKSSNFILAKAADTLGTVKSYHIYLVGKDAELGGDPIIELYGDVIAVEPRSSQFTMVFGGFQYELINVGTDLYTKTVSVDPIRASSYEPKFILNKWIRASNSTSTLIDLPIQGYMDSNILNESVFENLSQVESENPDTYKFYSDTPATSAPGETAHLVVWLNKSTYLVDRLEYAIDLYGKQVALDIAFSKYNATVEIASPAKFYTAQDLAELLVEDADIPEEIDDSTSDGTPFGKMLQ